jgi:hypothetical protein
VCASEFLIDLVAEKQLHEIPVRVSNGLVRQSERLAVPRDAEIEISDRQANVVDPRWLHPACFA